MKRLYTLFLIVAMLAGTAVPAAAQNWGRLITGGLELFQSFTVSDEQVSQLVSSYVKQTDTKSKVASASSPYTKRLNRIVSGLRSVDGMPLNFKVYITKDINAFACADGSVRVYSGLMDVMTDDEVLGVIGHEIGHVAHHDTRNAFKNALRTAAFRDALASTGNVVAAITDSQLGELGAAAVNAGFSRKQESNADDYAYDFLKSHGKNPLVLAMAFRKIGQLEQTQPGLIQQLFSSHPDTGKRISNIEKRAARDGFSYPDVK